MRSDFYARGKAAFPVIFLVSFLLFAYLFLDLPEKLLPPGKYIRLVPVLIVAVPTFLASCATMGIFGLVVGLTARIAGRGREATPPKGN